MLREYQQNAVDAFRQYLRDHDDNPCIVIPTGGGKSHVIAEICRGSITDGRVIILAHVRELLEQIREKILASAPELALQVGVYSAGLDSRDTDHRVIIAGIQSVYSRADELGTFDVAIIDEAHTIPADGEGMYRTFLAALKTINPKLRVVGLTATPYRLSTGSICAPGNMLNAICYEIGVKELITDGHICRLVAKHGRSEFDTSNLHIRAGEFVADEVDALYNQSDLIESVCKEILDYTRDRKSCLIFASGVEHGTSMVDALRRLGATAKSIFGDTDSEVRAMTIDEFKSERLKYLVNMGVLTHGFDAPNIDCVALVRPTMSPGLYYQMVGRGFRTCANKKDCLILDYGENVMRHGPVDAIVVRKKRKGTGDAPVKKCPECRALIACGFSMCPQCGYAFPPPELKHEHRASELPILSGQATREERDVVKTNYFLHRKYGCPTAPPTMRVEYVLSIFERVSEWICFEHNGYPRRKAEEWWKKRTGLACPRTVDDALTMINAGALVETKMVTIKTIGGQKYKEIVDYRLIEKELAMV